MFTSKRMTRAWPTRVSMERANLKDRHSIYVIVWQAIQAHIVIQVHAVLVHSFVMSISYLYFVYWYNTTSQHILVSQATMQALCVDKYNEIDKFNI